MRWQNPNLVNSVPVNSEIENSELTHKGDTPNSLITNHNSQNIPLTFNKRERLCSEKLIEELFRSGRRMMAFPYSVHWIIVPKDSLPEGTPAQVLIATSKKKFRHAVDRNRVKRLTRECYRLHKPMLYAYLNEKQLNLVLAINYIHNESFTFEMLMHKFDKLTASLIDSIDHSTHPEANINEP